MISAVLRITLDRAVTRSRRSKLSDHTDAEQAIRQSGETEYSAERELAMMCHGTERSGSGLRQHGRYRFIHVAATDHVGSVCGVRLLCEESIIRTVLRRHYRVRPFGSL